MTAFHFTQYGDFYAVRFRYDPMLVDLVKAVVPSFARSWDTNAKEWTVDAVYAAPLADAVRQLGHVVVGLEERRRDDRRDRHGDADWARTLFRRVGPIHHSAVYRALSRCLHPDAGGDKQLQQELNDAHAEMATRAP